MTLNKTSATLAAGGTETLTATVNPGDATDKTVTWSSDNTAVATVSNGVVTAVAEGTATITVTATNGTDDTNDDKTATCAVTVKKPEKSAPAPSVTSVTINSKTVSAKTLSAAIAKAGGNPESVTTVILGKKVKKIKKGTFQNLRNANTLVVKSKKLTKARVKGSLKGSSITKVKVNVGKKKTNKKYVKKYRKCFTKKNCGKKVSVSR